MLGLLTSKPEITQPPQIPPHDYKLDWIHQLELCESGGRANIKHLDSNNKYSYGILQYQMDTWLSYPQFGTTPENIYDPILQEQVTRYLLDKGETWHWKTCVRKTEAKLGKYENQSRPNNL